MNVFLLAALAGIPWPLIEVNKLIYKCVQWPTAASVNNTDDNACAQQTNSGSHPQNEARHQYNS